MSDELERRFEGARVLTELLAPTGTLADVEDIAQAFQEAHAAGAPPQAVISALWEDEPRFASPDDARRLFANLLGLYELVASGVSVDLSVPSGRLPPRPRASAPEPFAEEPSEGFVEAAWRYLDDAPKERQRLSNAFDNRHDGLVSWAEEHGLSDDEFALARQVLFEVFAFLELGGHGPKKVALPPAGDGARLPAALRQWVAEAVEEAVLHDEQPMTEARAGVMRGLLGAGAEALWVARG